MDGEYEDEYVDATRPAAIIGPRHFAIMLRRQSQSVLGNLAHFVTVDIQDMIYKAYVSLTNALLYEFFNDRIYRPIRDFQFMAWNTPAHQRELQERLRNLPRLPGA
jgi:hypothetical protein